MRKINIIANLQQNRKFVEGLRNLAEVCDIPIAEKESCCNTALYPFSQEGQEGWVQVEMLPFLCSHYGKLSRAADRRIS